MKIFLITTLLASTLSAVEPPKVQPANRYYSLWQNSAITDKPVVDKPEALPNDLEDWVLVGLEEYVTGKVVTIVNKKNPKERLRVPGPEDASKEFSILQVIKGQGSYLDTKVILQKGPHRGEVTFDSKYLVLRKAPPPKAQITTKKTSSTPTPTRKISTTGRKIPSPTQKSPLPPGATPAKSTQTNSTRTPPRTRFIEKPTK